MLSFPLFDAVDGELMFWPQDLVRVLGVRRWVLVEEAGWKGKAAVGWLT
jgi:hypothetical protein